jgi:hypothetical protein
MTTKEHPRFVEARERFDKASKREEFQGGRRMRCGTCGAFGQAVESFRQAKDGVAYHLEFTCPNGHTEERFGTADGMPNEGRG